MVEYTLKEATNIDDANTLDSSTDVKFDEAVDLADIYASLRLLVYTGRWYLFCAQLTDARRVFFDRRNPDVKATYDAAELRKQMVELNYLTTGVINAQTTQIAELSRRPEEAAHR
ncbi:hypothetical protein H2203_004632 [Taxawa tesnikishii (nom. ined.)]|nr:hypothetical protein H2203_004632 [Dothideales sp. JES 119]